MGLGCYTLYGLESACLPILPKFLVIILIFHSDMKFEF